MQKDIKHVWVLEHPVETVWEYLTDAAQLSKWLMKNDIKPVVGHKFQFHTRPAIKMGFDGIVYCEVLEIVPYKTISYSWKGGPGQGKITLDSIVTWTLIPMGNGTELILEHKGFNGLKNFIGYIFMNGGWKNKIRKRFIELLNSEK